MLKKSWSQLVYKPFQNSWNVELIGPDKNILLGRIFWKDWGYQFIPIRKEISGRTLASINRFMNSKTDPNEGKTLSAPESSSSF